MMWCYLNCIHKKAFFKGQNLFFSLRGKQLQLQICRCFHFFSQQPLGDIYLKRTTCSSFGVCAPKLSSHLSFSNKDQWIKKKNLLIKKIPTSPCWALTVNFHARKYPAKYFDRWKRWLISRSKDPPQPKSPFSFHGWALSEVNDT